MDAILHSDAGAAGDLPVVHSSPGSTGSRDAEPLGAKPPEPQARRIHSKTKADMTQPRVACTAPYRLHVLRRTDAGLVPECACGRQHMVLGDRYRYCTCGLSKTQPWCDDSHEGTAFTPLEIVCDREQSYYLVCGCKRTERPPFCDGSHIHVDWAALEW